MKPMIFALLFAALLISGCTTPTPMSPEMNACISSHATREQYLPVITRYADEDIVKKAVELVAIKHPTVINRVENGPQTIYTVEGFVEQPTSFAPANSVATYRVVWQGDHIVSLEFVNAIDWYLAYPMATT